MDPSTRQMANWERLRNEARQTDQLLEQQQRRLEGAALFDEARLLASEAASVTSSTTLTSSQTRSPLLVASVASPSPGTTVQEVRAQFDAADREMSSSLRRLEQTIVNMDEVCTELGPTSAAVRHTERFHGLLREKQQARQCLTTEFRQRLDRYEIGASRRSGDARRRTNSTDDEAAGAGVRILMDEQVTIRHTLNRVNGLVEQAEGTQDRLRVQRERFTLMGDKLVGMAERIPFVQDVLRRIDARRRREVVILGSVMSFLMFGFVFFL